MPRTCFSPTARALAVLGALLLGGSHASAGITVFLDYTSFEARLATVTSSAGVSAFTATEVTSIKAGVKSYLETAYTSYAVTFTETNPGGTFETLRFGMTTGTPGLFGEASQIDYRNLTATDIANVYTANFASFIESGDPRATQISELAASLGGTAAHELGHNLGLQHADAYGNPAITNYANTMDIQNGHILATGVSGLSEEQREAQRLFNQLEHAKLEFAEGLNAGGAKPSTAEQAGAHGTAATAQGVTLTSLPVAGAMGANIFEATLGATGEFDYYSFSVGAPTSLMANVVSDPLSRAGWNDVNTILDLIGPDGTTVLATNAGARYDDNTWDGAATLRSNDGFLLNVALASAGTYYLRVRGEGTNNTGSYELILLTNGIAAVPEPSTLALLAAGALGLGAWNRRRRRAA